jgi:hypothetical protein
MMYTRFSLSLPNYSRTLLSFCAMHFSANGTDINLFNTYWHGMSRQLLRVLKLAAETSQSWAQELSSKQRTCSSEKVNGTATREISVSHLVQPAFLCPHPAASRRVHKPYRNTARSKCSFMKVNCAMSLSTQVTTRQMSTHDSTVHVFYFLICMSSGCHL